jgi:hypothetical protein
MAKKATKTLSAVPTKRSARAAAKKATGSAYGPAKKASAAQFRAPTGTGTVEALNDLRREIRTLSEHADRLLERLV